MNEPLKSPLSYSGEKYDDFILGIKRDSDGNIINPAIQQILNQKISLSNPDSVNEAIRSNHAMVQLGTLLGFEIESYHPEATVWYKEGLRVEIYLNEPVPVKIRMDF